MEPSKTLGNYRVPRPIGRRLVILIVAFSAMLTVFITACQLLTDYRQGRADIEKMLDEVEVLLPPLAESVWTFNDEQIALALKAMSSLPNLQRVVITSANGRNQWSDGLPETPSILKRSYPLQRQMRGSLQQIGTLEITASLNDLNSRIIERAFFALLGNGLGTLVLVLFMLFIFRRLVAERIERMVGAVMKLEPEGLLHRSPLTEYPVTASGKEDEIDILQSAIKDMSESLVRDVRELRLARDESRKACAELDRYRENLEKLVEARTADLAKATNKAEAANAAKTHFLAAASHDLRQPMQAIGLFHDALIRTDLNAEQKNISEHLAQSIQSLGDLLNVLLDISRLDAGAVKPCVEVVQAGELIHKIDAEFAAMAAEKCLRFKRSFPPKGMSIITDGNLLMSLLRNLIGNAIKYTSQGGVLVAVRRRGNQALIQVWDTGIGIAPEQRENIFEEYVQIGNPERDRAKGLGLGLAIVKRIAALLETKVIYRSRVGKGSVFEFCLPLAQRASQAEPAVPSRPLMSLAGRRIVVLEDSAMVREAIQMSLESLGAIVSPYRDAEMALADSEITHSDFYITDFRLPGLSGLEFLEAVQQRSSKSIKAVLLTGDTTNRIEQTQACRWQMLHKPIDLPKLVAAIELQDGMR